MRPAALAVGDPVLLGARVLVVEDDPFEASRLAHLLGDAGNAVEVASDPGQVVAVVAAWRPDLIVLDHHLPGATGSEVCRELRAAADRVVLPIVAVTGDDTPAVHLELLRAGADDVLVKPVAAEVLLARLQGHLHRARAERWTERRGWELAAELRASQRELARRNTELEQLLATLPFPAWATDEQGRLTAANAGFADLAGASEAELLADPAWARLAAPLAALLHGLHTQVRETGAMARDACWIPAASADARRLEVTVSPRTAVTGEVLGMVGVAQDVTEVTRTTEDLARTTADLQRAQRLAQVGSWTLELGTGPAEAAGQGDGALTWTEETYRLLVLPVGSPASTERFLARVHPEDRDRVRAAWEAGRRSGSYRVEHRLVGDGAERWVRSTAEFDTDAHGRPVRAHGTVQDLSAERELAAQGARLRSVLDAAQATAFEWQPGTGAVWFRSPEDGADGLTGSAGPAGPAERTQPMAMTSELTHPEDLPRLLALARRLETGVQADGEVECRLRPHQGPWRWYRVFVRALPGSPGTGSFFGVAVDITERRSREEALAAAARRDALTGLLSRAGFLAELADRLEVTSGGAVEVVCIDLDDFATVDAALGREAADRVLQATAEGLRGWVAPAGGVARIGGDVFAVWLDPAQRQQGTDALAARVQAGLASLPTTVPTGPLTAGVGVARWTPGEDPPSAQRLLRRAEQARDRAKHAGPGVVEVFDIAVERARRQRYRQLSRLRRGLEAGELELHYQPIVGLPDTRLLGFEALLRWAHPEQGLLPPAAFLGVLESDDLVLEVGAWTLRRALAQLAAWAHDGLTTTVSVNVSPRELEDPELAARVRAGLALHPTLAPGQLKIELLETAIIHDLEAAQTAVGALRALGVSVALDDFGVGASSLEQLLRLGVDTVKIDRSFVQDLPGDADREVVVRTILMLAARFGVDVVAEGVETTAHGVLLGRLGCPAVQGYRIARPMPAAEVPAWARTWRPPAAWRDLQVTDPPPVLPDRPLEPPRLEP